MDTTETTTLEISETHEGWRIDGLSSLDWALGKLGAAEAELAALVELRNRAVNRLDAQVKLAGSAARHAVEYFTAQVAVYCGAHREELLTGKKKSRALPCGTVGWRAKGGRLQVVDEDAVAAWATAQAVAGIVTMRPVIDKAALTKHLDATGEVPPGCTLEDATDELYIKPAEIGLRLGSEPPETLEFAP